MTAFDIIEEAKAKGIKSQTILDNLAMAYTIINNPDYTNIVASISGGSDSDIVLDICAKVDVEKKIKYIWFNTGVEYQATKDHLEYLENRYNITIERYNAIKSIPSCCREYGQPFLSKRVSEMMERLQKNNFKWEDKSFDELLKEYPNCKSALRWWCNNANENLSGSMWGGSIKSQDSIYPLISI